MDVSLASYYPFVFTRPLLMSPQSNAQHIATTDPAVPRQSTKYLLREIIIYIMKYHFLTEKALPLALFDGL